MRRVADLIRSRRGRVFTSVALVPLLLVGLLGTPAATGDDLADAMAERKAIAAKIQGQRKLVVRLSTQQAALTTRIASARKKLEGLNANLGELKIEVGTLRANIALVRASYGNLEDQIEQIGRQLLVLQNEERRRQKSLAERKELLADRIRAAYQAEQVTLLETILSANSFTDALAQVGYYLDIGIQDQALARQIVQDLRDLAAIHQEVLGTRAETEVLREEMTARKVELDAQLVELKAAQDKLAELQRKASVALNLQRAEQNRLAKNQAALQAAIAKSMAARQSLTEKIDDLVAEKKREREARERAARENRPSVSSSSWGNIPSAYNGRLDWPMSGYVSQEFGCTGFGWEPPSGGCAHFHSGIDIVAPYGTPVRAAGPGTIVYVGWNYADGWDPAWIVIIAHSDNLQTWYAHMQPTYPPGISVGSAVRAGQILGYEGNTGKSTGPHLHWMARINGTFVNPRLFV